MSLSMVRCATKPVSTVLSSSRVNSSEAIGANGRTRGGAPFAVSGTSPSAEAHLQRERGPANEQAYFEGYGLALSGDSSSFGTIKT